MEVKNSRRVVKALIHNHGGEACGKVALYFNGSPVGWEVVRLSEVTLLDGAIPKLDAPLKCGACGTEVAFFVEDLVEIGVGYT